MKRSNPNETNGSTSHTPKRPWIRTGALAAAIALGAATTVFAIAPGARALAAGHDGAGGPHALFASMHGGHSPDEMHAHFDQVLSDAGTNPAQRAQIHAIMKQAMDAEHADMQRFHESCERLKTVLTASVIDDAAIRSIRAEQDRLVVATSHRLSDTMVAVARVLTPAQRAKLGADIDRMMMEHRMRHDG